jgi:hypothetical protein
MKISDISVDNEVVEQGGWVSNIPELEGVRLKCRGAQNKDWRRQAQALVNAVPRKKRTPFMDPEEMDRINGVLILNHGLLDWEGIEDENGQPVAYDKKKAAEYLKHQKFRDGALYACTQVADGIVDEIETVAGN